MVTRRTGRKLKKLDDNESKGLYRSMQRESSFDESKQDHESGGKPQLHKSPESSQQFDVVFWVTVALSQVVGVTCVVLVIHWCRLYGGFAWSSNTDLLSVHPLLMVLGLIFFYGDAILVYRVLHFLPKWILKWIHGCLQISAIVMSSIGLAAVFENHRRTNRADMYSLHSWIGITAFGFFCLQYVGSFAAFVYPGLSMNIRAKFMPFHTFFGLGIFVLSVATAEMGLTERLMWTGNYTSGHYVEAGAVGNTIGLFLVVFAFLVIFLATRDQYKRRPLPVDTPLSPTN